MSLPLFVCCHLWDVEELDPQLNRKRPLVVGATTRRCRSTLPQSVPLLDQATPLEIPIRSGDNSDSGTLSLQRYRWTFILKIQEEHSLFSAFVGQKLEIILILSILWLGLLRSFLDGHSCPGHSLKEDQAFTLSLQRFHWTETRDHSYTGHSDSSWRFKKKHSAFWRSIGRSLSSCGTTLDLESCLPVKFGFVFCLLTLSLQLSFC